MSAEAILTAVFAPITLAFIAFLIWLAKEHLTAIRRQVENSHGTNLRDDMDSIRRENQLYFEEMRKDMRGLRQEIRGIHQRIDRTNKRIDSTLTGM